jgi:hypothetical protein
VESHALVTRTLALTARLLLSQLQLVLNELDTVAIVFLFHALELLLLHPVLVLYIPLHIHPELLGLGKLVVKLSQHYRG